MKRSVRTRTDSPFAVVTAPGTAETPVGPAGAAVDELLRAAALGTASFGCETWALGAGLGRVSFCQASQSMRREKPKMKRRMSLWVSMGRFRVPDRIRPGARARSDIP